MSNCNNCKHETECNHNERYDYTHDRIIDYQTDKEHNSFKEISELLNEQEETLQNQKGYIILLEQKLEENGVILEPKDFD